MAIGIVKFFNADRGYGFISNEGSDKDTFVHITALEQAGMTTLTEGQKLSYELQTDGKGKTSAINLAAAD